MRATLKIFVLTAIFALLVAFLCPVSASAQEEKKGFLYFKTGYNSEIESSSLASNVMFGFGAGIRLPFSSQRHQFLLEPALAMHWPKKEFLGMDMYGYPIRLQSDTLLLDFNGAYSFANIEGRVLPYLTGGIGFLRNSFSLSDYGISLQSDSHFAKNVGAGLKYFLGEEHSWFVGFEAKNYWAGEGGKFKIITGTIGIRF